MGMLVKYRGEAERIDLASVSKWRNVLDLMFSYHHHDHRHKGEQKKEPVFLVVVAGISKSTGRTCVLLSSLLATARHDPIEKQKERFCCREEQGIQVVFAFLGR